MKKHTLLSAIAVAVLAAVPFRMTLADDPAPRAATNNAPAIVRLLNSRAAGSPRVFAEAAADVAREARAGKPLQQFVIAVVSEEPDAPEEAHLDKETRERYLADTQPRIEKLARVRNNPLAWYLLSLKSGDTNLLRRAAMGGNVQAQNAWGTFLVTSVLAGGAPSNVVATALSDAFGFFKKAAGEGDANGLYNLGTCYARALGTTRDDEKAFQCFRTAAEKGHPEAINNVGGFFREGRVVPQDLELATKWFEKSAAFKNPFGEFNYGLALQRGEGTPRDLTKAAEFFKLAAEGGCVEAIDAYGVALSRGDGVPENPLEAFRRFKQASDLGYPPAMENLALCYERGRGTAANERLALEWKIRSRAARGDRAAQSWLIQHGKQ